MVQEGLRLPLRLRGLVDLHLHRHLGIGALGTQRLEFGGGRQGLLAPPLEVVQNQLFFAIWTDGVCAAQSVEGGSVLERCSAERVVLATHQVIGMVHHRRGRRPYVAVGWLHIANIVDRLGIAA